MEQINEQDTEKQGKENPVTGFASTENVIKPYWNTMQDKRVYTVEVQHTADT